MVVGVVVVVVACLVLGWIFGPWLLPQRVVVLVQQHLVVWVGVVVVVGNEVGVGNQNVVRVRTKRLGQMA